MGWCPGFVTIVVLAMVVSTPARAQAPGLPTPAQPRAPERATPLERPQAPGRLQVPEPPTTPEPPGADTIRFTVHDVLIDGATVFDRVALEPMIAPLLNREVSLRDMLDLTR